MYRRCRLLGFTLISSSLGNNAVSLVFRQEMVKSTYMDLNRQWCVLKPSICGCQPGKFLWRSALVQNFPSEFILIKFVALKDLALLDRRSCGGESFALASLFCFVYALTRRTIKPSEVICYRWPIDIINDLKRSICGD